MANSDISTKEKILFAAQNLILKKGFVGTTVDEICDEARLTKGSFFHYFKNKEDLGKAVIVYYWEGQKQTVGSALFHKKKDPLDRVLRMIDFFIEVNNNPNFPKSCLVGNMTQELAETNARIRAACAKNLTFWSEFFKRELDAAIQMYIPQNKRGAMDAKGLADYFVTIIQGSFILIKATQDISIGEKNLKHFKRYLEHLFQTHSLNRQRSDQIKSRRGRRR